MDWYISSKAHSQWHQEKREEEIQPINVCAEILGVAEATIKDLRVV